VTIIAGLRGDEATLEGLCRELKKALGCGASVEGETIVVSGEMLERVKRWLEDAGAKRVIVGT
jgi:translation initiation factor 1